MTTSLYLRDLIAQTLGEVCQVYPNEAPELAEYPYAVFNVQTLTGDEIPKAGYLEVNVWDYYDTHSRAETILDKIEAKIKNNYFASDRVAFRAFYGTRQHVEDADKNIKRIQEKFIIRWNERGGNEQ